MNFNKLPLELVDYIKSYAVDMTDYAYYTTLKWVEIETFLNNLCNEYMIEKIDENICVDDFKRINWMYYDYIKMHPGKMWFWNDECTNYGGYIEKLIDYLIEFDKNPHDDLQKLNKINRVYKFITEKGERVNEEDEVYSMGEEDINQVGGTIYM